MTHKCMTPVHSFHGRYLRAYRLNYTLLPKAAFRYGCFLVSSSNVFWIPFLDQLGWDGFYNNWERFHSNCSRFTTHVKVEIKCIQRSKNKSSTSSLSLFFTQKWPFCKTYTVQYFFPWSETKILENAFEVVHFYESWRLEAWNFTKSGLFAGLFQGKFTSKCKIYRTGIFTIINYLHLIFRTELLLLAACWISQHGNWSPFRIRKITCHRNIKILR